MFVGVHIPLAPSRKLMGDNNPLPPSAIHLVNFVRLVAHIAGARSPRMDTPLRLRLRRSDSKCGLWPLDDVGSRDSPSREAMGSANKRATAKATPSLPTTLRRTAPGTGA